MSEYEYRVEYTIQRSTVDEDDWEEIGFGSSAAWSDLDAASYAVTSDLQNGTWETEGDHPDPADVLADIQVVKGQ
ncbi:hypothetical protein [Brevibacterium sediminis]